MDLSNRNSLLDRLEHSTMFHLSLGSKELFHSNFLYWLSIVDWDAFILVARKLAGVECFWWEDLYKRSDDRDENEIEVRREFHNFDLSIYVCVNREPPKEGSMEVKETWIPVLVLENKIKSLPRYEQLQEYTTKAVNEWKKKKHKKDIESLWKEQPISFVLLSLFIDEEFKTDCQYLEKVKPLFEVNWVKRNYNDLHDCLNNIHLGDESCLNQKILKDYCQFILALHELAENDWRISPNNRFVETIYPWALKEYCGDRQVRLRIDDIRQKVHYAQMEAMLKERLNEAGIEAIHASADKEKKAQVRYNTNFAHNIGILEISVRLKGDCAIFIQLQGHSYAHAFCYDKKDAAKELNNRRSSLECMFDFDELSPKVTNDFKRITKKYPSELQTNVLFPRKLNSRAKGCLRDYKYYGKSFVYQNVLIPEHVTIDAVIHAMVEDTKKCLIIFK